MASAGGDNSSWPMALRRAAHPQHDLAYQFLRRNRCDLCGGTIAGEFSYRCDACDFDAHGNCLRRSSSYHHQCGHASAPAPPAPAPPKTQNMPRPFTPMKKLDMDEVIKDIAKKIS